MTIEGKDFYDRYFNYIGLTESPRLYHRWTAVSIIAALLGRRLFIPFGHDNIYPNHYILLVGDPGARKGTAITPGKRLLKSSGFNKFSPDRLSPERFIIELENASRIEINGAEELIELENLTLDETSELYVAIGEFGDFIGDGNLNFIRLLTNLWDNLPEYKHPKIHGKSVAVPKPTVNIFAGTTSQDISTSIPVEAIGQGFFSRFILVFGEGKGRMYSDLPPVSDDVRKEFAKELIEIKTTVQGEIQRDESVRNLCHRIYTEFVDIDDYRFKHYSTRRYTHFLKLAMCFAAMRHDIRLSKDDCINANTLLHYTELRMHKALGEYGKAKNADVTNAVMHIIRSSLVPPAMKDIYKKVSQDLNKQSDLIDILNNLKLAGKIQVVDVMSENRKGYAPLNIKAKQWSGDLINDDFLMAEERM